MRRLRWLIAVLCVACGDGVLGPGELGRYEPLASCLNGEAAGFACGDVDLLGHLSLEELDGPAPSGAGLANDVWGWTDPSTGRRVVLVGRERGVTFVDATDPTAPVVLGRLPSPTGFSTWRDVKVISSYAYVVADASPGHGVQLFDLRRLRDVETFTEFTEDARYDRVSSVHNIAVNEETGFAYAAGSNGGGESCGGGLHMIDAREPGNPSFAGCFAEPGTGRAGKGYTHDAQCVSYDGPDTRHRGREICFASNETALVVADVTDKGAPTALATASYPNAAYVHQGWLTPDRRYFLQNDELDELSGVVSSTRMLVWDVSDLEDPVLVREYAGPTPAVDHNIYVRGDLAFYSNYTYGLRIVDVGNPRQPAEVGHFDTHPSSDAPGFNGSWSNYPFFEDGVVAVTSSHDGLFLLQRSR